MMTSFAIGSMTVVRVEESGGLGFQAKVLLPDWHDGIVEAHGLLRPAHFGAPHVGHVARVAGGTFSFNMPSAV